VVITEPYDGLSPIDAINQNSFAASIQIHKLPIGYRDKAMITKQTEKNVGYEISVEMEIPGVNNFVSLLWTKGVPAPATWPAPRR
jgi:hypothetical protein